MSEYYSYFDTTINIYDIQSEIKNIINSNNSNTYVSPIVPPGLSTDSYISPSAPPGLSTNTQIDFSFELSNSHFEPLINQYENIDTDEHNDKTKVILNKIKIMSDDDELFNLIKNIFDTYELGKKNIIGLRQILKQKIGEKYLKKFDKKLSFKSSFWRNKKYINIFKNVIQDKSNEFKIVLNIKTSMIYLSKLDYFEDRFKLLDF